MNTGIQDTEQNKSVFDPAIHTELIIKDEYGEFDSGNEKSFIVTIKSIKMWKEDYLACKYNMYWTHFRENVRNYGRR